MSEFYLHVRAPFAAFRWLQAGVYRATSPVMPPSAAWGLVLNLAHVETRGSLDGATTATCTDAPAFEIAVGSMRPSQRSSLYQQLHGYPVGASGKELAAKAKGSKYWIAPARRELLVDFECLIGVRTQDDELSRCVRAGLAGSLDKPRYGLPFAGDNNLLFDTIHVRSTPLEVFWYERIDEEAAPRLGSCRLTVAIDRLDSSRTVTQLFAPTAAPQPEPPARAWNWVPRSP